MGGLKGYIAKQLARYVVNDLYKKANNPSYYQEKIFRTLVQKVQYTEFGKDHRISGKMSYEEYKAAVPVRDYEDLRPYFDKIKQGQANVCRPGKPIYLAKTSGTTSGTKYIPITKDSMKNHIQSARNALLCYIHDTGKTDFLDGKMMFLSGSPELDKTNEILSGRLSGIVNHHIPRYLQNNKLPSYTTNCIENWEEKLDHIVKETITQDMRLISGIPPWVQMYFDKLIEQGSNKKIQDIFPNCNLFVYGGVNFEPYRNRLQESIGKEIDTIETYPASEGFIALQHKQNQPGLLPVIDNGIFYEFIKSTEFFEKNPQRYRLHEVELNTNYALIINNNAGLFGYSIGDTVKFCSTFPHTLVVTGRIKHFISAFGEHVIGEEIEQSLQNASKKHNISITEFTVAPMVSPKEGLPYHEWLIEFEQQPTNETIRQLATSIDENLQEKNIYYKDLRAGNTIANAKITPLKAKSFLEYMKSIDKLGGQNKVVHVSNDRTIADVLTAMQQEQSL